MDDKDKMKNKFILDACCGGRMMWINKKHPNTLYIDIREENKGHIPQQINHEVKPDIVIDFHGFGPHNYKYRNFVKCLSKIEGKKGWKKPDIKKKKRKKVKKVVKKVDNLAVV